MALGAEGRIRTARRWAGHGLAPALGQNWTAALCPVPAAPHTAGCAWAAGCNGHREVTQPQGMAVLHTVCAACTPWAPAAGRKPQISSGCHDLCPLHWPWHSLEATWNSSAASVLTPCHLERPAVGTVQALLQHSLVGGDL